MHSPALDDARATANRYRPVLLLCAVYDGLIGLAFLFLPGPLFRLLGIEPAADPVYVQLAAGLIALMGLAFYLAWRNPVLNRDIVLLGVAFKAFYILLAAYALARGEVPHPVFLVFAGVDVLFLIVFVRLWQGSAAAHAAVAARLAGERGR
jgi:hypothetical protein